MAKISEIMLLQRVAQLVLIREVTTDMNGLPNAIGESFMKMAGYLEKKGLVPTDIPFVLYKDFETLTEQNIKMIAGIKISNKIPDFEDIKCVELPEQKIVYCLHKGSYDELANLYNEMMAWIKSKRYKADGSCLEYYYTGPEIPEKQQVTRVEMPLLTI